MSRVNLEALVDELKAAGLWGGPFTVRGDGIVESERLTPEELAAVRAVVKAHDPDAPRDAESVRREDRAQALAALLGIPLAEAALDGFLKSIKARPDLPETVRAYIRRHGL